MGPVSSSPLRPGTPFAGYEIEEMVGRGGMGVVYRAVELYLERTVALKVIAPEYIENAAAVSRFTSEARLAASIDHPNVVPIYRAGEFEGVLFLAMQFVPGTNLRRVISQHGALDLAWIGGIVAQVASALDAAHMRGLVHRDVKPANILLAGETQHEHVYLADFGLTKRLSDTNGSLTRSGQWVGTPDYAAPEQIQDQDIDARTDVYSLGCVLYELLTGHVAYERGSAMAKLWAHVADPPPTPCAYRSELLPVFDSLLARATAKQPEERFSSADELSRALEGAVELQLAQRAGGARQPVAAAEATTLDAPVVIPLPSPPALEQQFESESKPVATESACSTPSATPAARGPAPRLPDGARGQRGAKGHTRWLVPAVALLVAVIAAVVLTVALTGGGAGTAAKNAVNARKLKQDVSTLNTIVQLFIQGHGLSHVQHNYNAAIQNRQRVLDHLTVFRAPAELRDAAATLRRMTQDSLEFNLQMAAGKKGLAQIYDKAHNALRRTFLDQFNRYAQYYLGITYQTNQL